jgi:hypothetical protein
METSFIDNLALGFSVALSFQEPAFALLGALIGHRHRRAAGHRAGGHHLAPAADHLRPAGDHGHHHAGGHLLRRAVRRLHHGHPAQPAGEISSVVTTLEGYKMARNGRAGAALATSAIGSFFAGSSPRPRRRVRPAADAGGAVLRPGDYFSLMLLG